MIQANYIEMEQAAKEISEAANGYNSKVNELYAIVDNLTSVWKGSDNVEFINTVNGYKGAITDLGKIVKNYAVFLTKAAAQLRDTQSGVFQAARKL